MNESFYEVSNDFADALKDNKNSSEGIYMNEVPEAQVTKTNETSLASVSKPTRCYRLAVVCLLMLVVLLLVAIAMLWVNFINLTTERDQLQTSYNNLTIERDQLKTSYNNLTEEKNQLQASYKYRTSDKADLETSNKKLANERDQFQRSRDELQKRYSQLKKDINTPGWRYFSSSIYYISTEKKSWREGREDCRRRGADLVIIKSREEQDFVEVWRRGEGAWTGANDIDREGNWKWVDGTPVISGFWSSGEPNNKGDEDCAVSGYRSEPVPNWVDVSCSSQYIWICEKKINS
ncbi:uncharacterized protein Hap1MRO34_007003 [Clarias gariepinus]|uniref:CD209 antigen-like protein C n=1 Tax=Clarias gariepinus TaxID=13013 RepID=UPI00234DF0CA|nr:CD209 antigen-like protein C [Clarias gariepinus]